MEKGHVGNFHTTPKRKGKPPAVEVRTHLPITRGKAPSATYIPEAKGEYFEEDTPQNVEMDVPLPPGLESIRKYAFHLVGQGLNDSMLNGTCPPLDNAGEESQDSGLGYASVTEVDLKEHAIGKERVGPPGSSRKIISRDPRQHSVTIASPSTLYGATTSPMADPVNVAESAYEGPHLGPTAMEDGEPPLVIDIVNIESE